MVIPTPSAAEAARDAARLLQAPGRLHDHEEARVAAVEAAAAIAAVRLRGCGSCRGPAADGRRSATARAANARRSRCWKPASSARSITRSSRPSRADDLFKWLKDNKYSYSGDEATLNFYVQKKWLFTVMKIDTMQMKTQQGRHLRRRGHADALPVRQREARLPAEDHADLGEGQDRGAVLRAGAVQGRSAGRHDLPVHVGADAAERPRLVRQGHFGTNDLPGKADDWLKAVEAAGRGRSLQKRAANSASTSSAASGRSRTRRATSRRRWNGPAS